jgi:leader peptidase (prepilin peptidase) / N-methyltransferase
VAVNHTVLIGFFFLFGLIIGSFLNVCITRIPEGLSIVAPASRCPKCGTPIKPYDNVPVLGWIWLGGKCRACKNPISPMYPLIELTTGLLFVAAYLSFDLSSATLKWLFFTCLIIVLTITDLRVRLLPDLVTWPGIAAGLVFSALVPPDDGFGFLLGLRLFHRTLPNWQLGLIDGALGALFGSLVFWGLGFVFSRLLGRPAFGLGDVKMLAMVGAFMGIRGVFFTMLFGSLVGSLIGTGLILALYLSGWKRHVAERASRRGIGKVNQLRRKLAKRYQLPMGSYLGVGALVVVYFANAAPLVFLWMNRLMQHR